MIISSEIKPELNIYVIGSRIIQILSKSQFGCFDFDILYNKYEKKFSNEISLNYFLYSLDYLYLLGLIERNEMNEIYLKNIEMN